MHNFGLAILDCSYTFRLLENIYHQAVYQNYKTEIAM
jgi:hypothetical protein